MTNLLNDLRYAFRQLRKSPGFAIAAILTLALGIGANTGMFTVLEAMLLRALPIHNAQRVVYITENAWPDNVMETGNSQWTFTLPVFEQLRQQKHIFKEVLAYAPLSINEVDVRVGQTPMTADADMVSGNFFQMLGVSMLRGRAFGLQDEKQHSQVVVISYNFWTRAYSRNPDAIGQTLFIKGIPFTIVGVAAQNFAGVEPATFNDFWIPLQNRPDIPAWGISPAAGRTLYGTRPWACLMMMGRMAPGKTRRRAEAQLNPLLLRIWYSTLGRTIPPKKNLGVALETATGMGPASDWYRQPLRFAMGLVLLVLLIALTNVAMLVMARNATRQREIAVRVALGAGRMTLLRQLLAESLLLVAVGAGLGWAFAAWVAPMLAKMLDAGMDMQLDFSPDRRVLWLTLGAASLATLVFGLAPMVSAMRISPTLAMKSGNASAGMNRNRLLGRRLAVSAQTAVCVVLLVAAALMVRTLRQYQTEDLGIRTQGLLVFSINPIGMKSDAQAVQFYQNLLDKLRVLPGVESATVTDNRLGAGWSDNNNVVLDGVMKPSKGMNDLLRTNNVGPDFFHALGIPILQGRGITAADTADAQHVAVVNQTLVDRFLPHTNPLGHTLGPKGHTFTIVGVARDSKFTSVDEPKMPMAWYPYAQVPGTGAMSVELRILGNPLAILPTVRRVVRQINPNLPLDDPQTQQAVFDRSYFFNALTAGLTTFFGLLAALLVAIGLYGTLAYRVSRRTQEIGVRMALGATRENVQWMVLRESLWMVALGMVVGAPLSLAVGKWMQSQLYKLSWHDPLAMLGAFIVVGMVALVSSLLPARRAASIDPMQALRSE